MNEMLKTKMIDGIHVNPERPEDFGCTPNEERSAEEMDKWWEVPYVEVDGFSVPDENYQAFVERMTGYAQQVEKEAEYNAQIEEWRRGWFEAYPTGYRFTVRCLDGGAWDRPTNYGCFGALADAIHRAKGVEV